MARIFKEKYFPNSSFLDSPVGKKPSYAWRSIWNAKPLLREGLVWRVGDGNSISIWGDRWLPVHSTHAVQSPIRLLEGNAKVEALINNNTRWWNVPLMEAIFNPKEASIICGIPICPSIQVSATGRVLGRDAKSGFVEKIMAVRRPKSGEDVHVAGLTLYAPSADWKLRPCAMHCGHVRQHRMSGMGVLASFIKVLWLSAIPDIVVGLLDRLDADEVDVFACTARQVWLRRNKWVFEGKFSSPVQLLQMASDQVEATKSADQGRQEEGQRVRQRPLVHWRLTPPEFVKCNWDAAIDSAGKRMGVGIVIRNHVG
ncbi:uncharacterized protein LOC132169768 [Corylus avellana]|uniref:uncharacterized protein LOC132169768 n=1 Tax=Corylus avellana TaxID=13451 RepID=UPI00286BFC47|nr:uncharacterized protein LOC132169768 [Corylus avellana]